MKCKKKEIYPLFGIFISLCTLIIGLILAKNIYYSITYLILILFYISFGYFKQVLKLLLMSIIMILIFSGLTYLISQNINQTIVSVNRILACSFSVMPGLIIKSDSLIKNLEGIKVPKSITLGMMITINFFPLLRKEMSQIRQAMKTRGASSIINIRVLYRAFLIPLIVRIVNISDTLSTSLETRCFGVTKDVTIYNEIKLRKIDILFILIFILSIIIGGIASWQLNLIM